MMDVIFLALLGIAAMKVVEDRHEATVERNFQAYIEWLHEQVRQDKRTRQLRRLYDTLRSST